MHRENNLSITKTEGVEGSWHRKVSTEGKNPNHLHMPICQGLVHGDSEQDDMAHDLEGLMKQVQTCSEVGKGKAKEQMNLNGVQVLVHYNHFCVAQNTKWKSPFNSLDFFAPKENMAWPLLNSQSKGWNSEDLEGLSAKLTPHHYLRAQIAKKTSPWDSLGNSTPKTYMGWHVWGRETLAI